MNSYNHEAKTLGAGDWNAFFGFGTNILVNLLTLTALLRFVLKMPDDLVFGRILPATGLMLCLSTLYYAWLAYRLAKQTGRSDVCALPSGISVPHMFVVTFVIMLPIALKTGDPIKGWEAGLTWVFIQSFVLMVGGFVGPIIRRITPRAALLGTLAGVSVTFISMAPAVQMFMTPLIGIVCFAIILLSWFGGVKYRGIPAGLVAIAVGTAIAWGSTAVGLSYGGLSLRGLADAVANFGFRVPIPAVGHVFSGFEFLGVILVTAIPFGIYDLVEALDNVESAAAAGDEFPTTRVLTADGVVSLIGCLMGNPFINAVYIGHPGWKAMGRTDRLLGGNGGGCDSPVLVRNYFAHAGAYSDHRHFADSALHRNAHRFASIPGDAQEACSGNHSRPHSSPCPLGCHSDEWSLAAAGTFTVTDELAGKMRDQGVLYRGLEILGGGSILGGLILGAVAVCIIDRNLVKAAGFALAGAILTFFGFMHGQQIGIAHDPSVALSYLVVAGLFAGCAKLVGEPGPKERLEHAGALPQPVE